MARSDSLNGFSLTSQRLVIKLFSGNSPWGTGIFVAKINFLSRPSLYNLALSAFWLFFFFFLSFVFLVSQPTFIFFLSSH